MQAEEARRSVVSRYWLPVAVGLGYVLLVILAVAAYATGLFEAVAGQDWVWAAVYALVVGCRVIAWTVIWLDGGAHVRFIQGAVAPVCGAMVTEAFVLVAHDGNEVVSALAGGVFGVAFLIFWWLIELRQKRRYKPSGRCGTLVQCPKGRLRQCLWLNDWQPCLMSGGVWARHVCALETVGEVERAVQVMQRGMLRHSDAPEAAQALESGLRAVAGTGAELAPQIALLESVISDYRGAWVGYLAREALEAFQDGQGQHDGITLASEIDAQALFDVLVAKAADERSAPKPRAPFKPQARRM